MPQKEIQKETRTIAARNQDLELVALGIGRATRLAVVSSPGGAHGRAEEGAAHHDVGGGVGAGGAWRARRVALEVDVDYGA